MSKPESNIYVISDNHFLHSNIIEFCKRPFQTEEEMNKRMQKLWNATIRPQDLVIHLGDLIWTKGKSEDVSQCIKSLNGRKILVRGNHDRKTYSWYLSNGIDFVCDRFSWDYNSKRVLFVHDPAHTDSNDLKRYDFILHGHCHNNVPFLTRKIKGPYNASILGIDHWPGECILVNLSVENIKYTPICLNTLLSRLTQGYYDKKVI